MICNNAYSLDAFLNILTRLYDDKHFVFYNNFFVLLKCFFSVLPDDPSYCMKKKHGAGRLKIHKIHRNE